jgi:hypothetical protein
METALLQQLLNIAQRERKAKVPPERTEYEAGFGLTPFEDRGSGYHFAILSRHQPELWKLQHIPVASSVVTAATCIGDGSANLGFVDRLSVARGHENRSATCPSCDRKRDDFYEEIDTCLNACASDRVIVRRAPCGRIAERQGRE